MLRTIRDLTILTALSFGAVGYDRRDHGRGAPAEPGSVILVVADGLRWQEVFRGADSAIVFGSPKALGGNAEQVRRAYWRPTVTERRRALMPFVWSTIAREGTLIGNRDVGSRARVTNGLNFSYPGYNELLTGYPDPRIDRNDYGPNPNVTVLEWLNGQEGVRGSVAAAGAWDTFADILNRGRSGLPMHVSRVEPLNARTHAAAMRYLGSARPRALFVAYVETDDRAHAGRYDQLLDEVHAVDGYLAALWRQVQSDPAYRGRTTLIFTADHGRGSNGGDWKHHGEHVAGSDQIFIAAIGPSTPALGEVRGGSVVAQSRIAATVAAATGYDFARAMPRVTPPLHVLVPPQR